MVNPALQHITEAATLRTGDTLILRANTGATIHELTELRADLADDLPGINVVIISMDGEMIVHPAADPHPWQEWNAHGNTCHYPGCRLTESEHAQSSDGRAVTEASDRDETR